MKTLTTLTVFTSRSTEFTFRTASGQTGPTLTLQAGWNKVTFPENAWIGMRWARHSEPFTWIDPNPAWGLQIDDANGKLVTTTLHDATITDAEFAAAGGTGWLWGWQANCWTQQRRAG